MIIEIGPNLLELLKSIAILISAITMLGIFAWVVLNKLQMDWAK